MLMMSIYAAGGADPCHASEATLTKSIVPQVRGPGSSRSRDAHFDWLAAVPSDSGVMVEERSRSGRLGTERLWKEYFGNPSQWWDNRESKTNPRSPDFKHKTTKQLLWIDDRHNPDWVKDMLEERAKASIHHAQDRCWVEEHGKVAKANASKAQDMREKSGWEKLSLEEALTSVEQQPQLPSLENLSCILHKCRTLNNPVYTKRLYAYMCKSGLEDHRFFGNYLIPMLVQIGSIWDGQQVFNKLVDRNVYSWTSLISGYVECGGSQHALNLYEKMQEDYARPNRYTFVAILKACARLKDAEKGRKIHAEISRMCLETDYFVGNTLVDMYAKCGLLAESQEAFDKLPSRDIVSWTALMTGYAEHGLAEDTLNCFDQIQVEGLSPDAVTFVCSLNACGSTGAIDKGRELHAEIARKGLQINVFVGNTLVDMYAQCASLAEAQDTFDKLPIRDVVSWSALMAGYAQVGESGIVFHMLEGMRGEGVNPNQVTFSIVLTVCSHTGLVNKGQMFFEGMSKDYDIIPNIKHHASMVDLLGRAGQLDEAVTMVNVTPFHPNIVVWLTVLGACRKWGNVKLGRVAFEHAVQLDEKKAAAYTLMSNIYADAHMQMEEEKIEAMRLKV